MLYRCLLVVGCMCLGAPERAGAQTRLRLSTIIPGTEKVQLVYNGDFQFQGPLFTNQYPLPTGWSRQANMFTGAGTNLVSVNSGVAALGDVSTGASASLYRRTVSLEPNTSYVLSAYLWNLGNSTNRVNTNVDLNDVPQEPQIGLSYSDASADKGYFVYRTFNTANTGSNVTLRVFYDGLVGTGAAAEHYPIGAQWDNVAITKSADFLPPQASGSGANMRPIVSITSPADAANLYLEAIPAALEITATATDLDGSVTKVEFYAATNKLGEATTSPYHFIWSNLAAGSYRLTAIATDNNGASTISAPVLISVGMVPQPVALSIAPADGNLTVSWPTSATAASLQMALRAVSTNGWKLVTNPPVASNGKNLVSISNTQLQQYFRLGDEVDATTLDRKVMMGYQGWFACPQDGSPYNNWVHWFRGSPAVATNATVDFWPDISELDSDELFATAMTLPDGSPARVFSSYPQKTVVRHFKWMKDNHLDGVFLQRFSSTLSDQASFAVRNQVAASVRLGAGAYGRVFAMMYDISGQSPTTLISTLTNDWAYLVNTMGITNSPRYLRHKGKPVVAIWGFGFTDRPGTPQDAQAVIGYFRSAGCTVMGGVPTYWRTLTGDSQTASAWASVYRSFDIISPWSVGRYGTLAQADSFKANLIVPDLAEATARGRDYLPVIFPGFSWYNLNHGPLNQIPRLGGAFYWRQAFNAVSAGCSMIYVAMFDEVDEGTAMFKMAPTPAQLPAQGSFVPLNIDGQLLPSDWYLRLAGESAKMLRGEIPLDSAMPIQPP